MSKTIIAIIVVIVAAGLGGYFIFRNTDQPISSVVPVTTQQTTEGTAEPTLASEASTAEVLIEPSIAEIKVDAEIKTEAKIAEEKTVTYTDSGFSPATLTIKKGETVVFKNQSAQSMWPASAKHPTHTAYPTTGGCIGSTFDACKGVQPDNSWSFKFEVLGSWKYHDHLTPKDRGTITVE